MWNWCKSIRQTNNSMMLLTFWKISRVSKRDVKMISAEALLISPWTIRCPTTSRAMVARNHLLYRRSINQLSSIKKMPANKGPFIMEEASVLDRGKAWTTLWAQIPYKQWFHRGDPTITHQAMPLGCSNLERAFLKDAILRRGIIKTLNDAPIQSLPPRLHRTFPRSTRGNLRWISHTSPIWVRTR